MSVLRPKQNKTRIDLGKLSSGKPKTIYEKGILLFY
jgi:hypothetical protein